MVSAALAYGVDTKELPEYYINLEEYLPDLAVSVADAITVFRRIDGLYSTEILTADVALTVAVFVLAV